MQPTEGSTEDGQGDYFPIAEVDMVSEYEESEAPTSSDGDEDRAACSMQLHHRLKNAFEKLRQVHIEQVSRFLPNLPHPVICTSDGGGPPAYQVASAPPPMHVGAFLPPGFERFVPGAGLPGPDDTIFSLTRRVFGEADLPQSSVVRSPQQRAVRKSRKVLCLRDLNMLMLGAHATPLADTPLLPAPPKDSARKGRPTVAAPPTLPAIGNARCVSAADRAPVEAADEGSARGAPSPPCITTPTERIGSHFSPLVGNASPLRLYQQEVASRRNAHPPETFSLLRPLSRDSSPPKVENVDRFVTLYDRIPGFLPLEVFDDPEEHNRRYPAAGCRAESLKYINGQMDKMEWAPCRVLRFDPASRLFEIQWDGGGRKLVSRYNLRFKDENPAAVQKRLKEVQERRAEAERELRTEMVIACMEDDEERGIEEEVLARIVSTGLGSIPSSWQGRVAQYVQQVRAEHMYALRKDRLSYYLLSPSFREKVRPLAINMDLGVDEQQRGYVHTEPRQERRERFVHAQQYLVQRCFRVMPTTQSALLHVMTAWSCPEDYTLISMKPTGGSRVVSLMDFVHRQQQHAIAGHSRHLMRWRTDVEAALLMHLDVKFQGSFSNEAVYRASDLARFLRLVTYMMAAQLRTLALLSIKQYSDYFKAFGGQALVPDIESTYYQFMGMAPMIPPGSVLLSIRLDAIPPSEALKEGSIKAPSFVTESVAVGEKDEETAQSPPDDGGGTPVIDYVPTQRDVHSYLQKVIDYVLRAVSSVPLVESSFLSSLGLPQRFIQAIDHSEATEARMHVTQILAECRPSLDRLMRLYKKFEDVLLPCKWVADRKLLGDMTDTEPICREVKRLLSTLDDIARVSPDSVHCKLLFIDCSPVKRKLRQRCHEALDMLFDEVTRKIIDVADAACDLYQQLWDELLHRPTSPEAYHEFRISTSEKRKRLERVEEEDFALAFRWMGVLEQFNRSLCDEHAEKVFLMRRWPGKIVVSLAESDALLVKEEREFLAQLERDKEALREDIKVYRARAEELASQCDYDQTEIVAGKAKAITRLLEDAFKRAELCSRHEEIFGLQVTEWAEIVHLQEQVLPFHIMWNTAHQWLQHSSSWNDAPLESLDAKRMGQLIADWHCAARKSIRAMRGFPKPQTVAKKLLNEVIGFHGNIDWVSQLSFSALRLRHWKQLAVVLKRPEDLVVGDVTIANLLKWGVTQHKNFITQLTEQAQKEWEIEHRLETMKASWREHRLHFDEWCDHKVLSSQVGDELLAQLDKQIMITQQLRVDQYVTPFEKAVRDWEMQLLVVQDLLLLWLDVQAAWMKLYPVFTNSDISKSLGLEVKRFEVVDTQWKEVMSEAESTPRLIILATAGDELLPRLKDIGSQLGKIQRELTAFLDERRKGFPRFFWLSTEDLLGILSSSKDPLVVQPHIPKCFGGIHSLQFSEFTNDVEMMVSAIGERVPLQSTVCTSGVAVTKWLREVEVGMSLSLQRLVTAALKDSASSPLKAWMFAWPHQVTILVMEIIEDHDITEVLKLSGRRGTSALLRKTGKTLDDVSELLDVKFSMPLVDRIILESVIQQLLKTRDRIERLISTGVSDPQAFDYLVMGRYILTDNSSNTLSYCCLHNRVPYKYEYLGTRTRIVHSPLVERAQRTILSASAMNAGSVLLTGPSKVGKTETVLDLAVAVGSKCVVLTCSEEIDRQAIISSLVGVIAVGAFCLLDRIDCLPYQLAASLTQVFHGLRNEVSLGRTVIALDYFYNTSSDVLPIHPGAVIVATSSPSDTTTLKDMPPSLRSVFRPCHMMLPDYRLVAHHLLYKAGCYSHCDSLSHRLVHLLRITSSLITLPPMMALIMSICGTVGKILSDPFQAFTKAHGDTHMDELLKELWSVVAAVRAVLGPHAERSGDMELLDGIMQDCMAGTGIPLPHVDKGPSVPCALLLLKKDSVDLPNAPPAYLCDVSREVVRNLNQAFSVCRTVVLVGPPESGKSMCIDILAATLPQTNQPVVRYLAPHSVPAVRFYGCVDEEKDAKMHDGVLPMCLRQLAQHQGPTWLVLDGNVGEWCSRLSSLFSPSTRVFQCATGETIEIPSLHIILETETMCHATPDTLAHALVVMPGGVDWRNVLRRAWEYPPDEGGLPSDLDPYRQVLYRLTETVFQQAWDALKGIADTMGTMTSYASRVARVFNALVRHEMREDGIPQAPEYETVRIFVEVPAVHAVLLVLSGALPGDKRDEFGHRVTQLIPEWIADSADAMLLPPDLSPLECSIAEGQWHKSLDPIYDDSLRHLDPDGPVSDQLVLTCDMSRCINHAEILLASNVPVLLVGGPCTGKTRVLHALGRKGQGGVVRVPLTHKAESVQLQQCIEQRLTKRRQGVLGPSLGRRLLLELDDLHLPDEVPFCTAHELVYSFLRWGGWTDLNTLHPIKVTDVRLACTVLASEFRHTKHRRLYTKFVPLYLAETLSVQSLANICQTIFQSWMGRHAGHLPQQAAEVVTKAWLAAKDHFPSLPLVSWSARDIFAMVQGVIVHGKERFGKKHTLLSLLAHEIIRVIGDRLPEPSHMEWFDNRLLSVMSTSMRVHFSDTVARPSKLVFTYTPAPAVAAEPREVVTSPQVTLSLTSTSGSPSSVPFDDDVAPSQATCVQSTADEVLAAMSQAVAEFRERGNLEGLEGKRQVQVLGVLRKLRTPAVKVAPAPLDKIKTPMLDDPRVLCFPYIDASLSLVISRIVRALRQPKGCCMVVTDLGEEELVTYCTIAGWVCNTKVVIHPRTVHWKATLQHCVSLAAAKGSKGVTWVVSDSTLTSQQAADLSVLFQREDITGLLPGDCVAQLCGALAEEARAHDSKDTMQYVVDKISRNLHLVLIAQSRPTSPVHAWRRAIPSFFTYPSILHLTFSNVWTHATQLAVACKIIEQASLGMDNTRRVAEVAVRAFTAIREGQLNGAVALPPMKPCLLVHMVETFCRLYRDQKQRITPEKRRYELTTKLAWCAREQFAFYTREAVTLDPMLLNIREDATRIAEEIAGLKNEAVRIDAAFSAMEVSCMERVQAHSRMKEECQSLLDAALPAFEKAKAELLKVDDKQLASVKHLATPAPLVRKVMNAVCILLKEKPEKAARGAAGDSMWQLAQRVLDDPKFIRRVATVNPDKLPPKASEHLRQCCETSSFHPDKIRAMSMPVIEKLSGFLVALEQRHRVMAVAGPQQDHLEADEMEIKAAIDNMEGMREKGITIQHNIQSLQRRLVLAGNRVDQLEGQKRLWTRRKAGAAMLLGVVDEREPGWTETLASLKKADENLEGDIMLASVLFTLLPSLGPCRTEALKLASRAITGLVSVSSEPSDDQGYSAITVCGLDDEADTWCFEEGLVDSRLQRETAAMVLYCNKWPLLVDPHGAVTVWLRRHFGRALIVANGTLTMLTQSVRDAARVGAPILVEWSPRVYAEMKPILRLKKKIDEAAAAGLPPPEGGWKVALGQKDDTEVRSSFRLFFYTNMEPPPPSQWEAEVELVTIIDCRLSERDAVSYFAHQVAAKYEGRYSDDLTNTLRHVLRSRSEQASVHKRILTAMSNAAVSDVLWLPPKVDEAEEAPLFAADSIEKGSVWAMRYTEAPDGTFLLVEEEMSPHNQQTVLDKENLIKELAAEAFTAKRVDARCDAAVKSAAEFTELTKKKYLPVANIISSTYRSYSTLATLCPMYGISLSRVLAMVLPEIKTRDAKTAISNWDDEVSELAGSVAAQLFSFLSMGLFPRHKTVLALIISAHLEMAHGRCTDEDWRILLNLPPPPESDLLTPPHVPPESWSAALSLSASHSSCTDLAASMADNKNGKWTTFFRSGELPDQWCRCLTHFQQLIVIRHVTPWRFAAAVTNYSSSFLLNYERESFASQCKAYLQARGIGSTTPITILRHPASPESTEGELKRVAWGLGGAEVVAVGGSSLTTMNKIQSLLRRAEGRSQTDGMWLLLQDASATGDGWHDYLLRLVGELSGSQRLDTRFRLWFEADVHHPVTPVLYNTTKFAMHHPSTVRAQVIKSLETGPCLQGRFTVQDVPGKGEYHQLLRVCTAFHALVLERRKLGLYGWTEDQPWCETDFEHLVELVERGFKTGPYISLWQAATHFIQDLVHGAYVSSELLADRTASYFLTLVETMCTPTTSQALAPWQAPGGDHAEHLSMATNLPLSTPHELLGLPAGVVTTHHKLDAAAIVSCLSPDELTPPHHTAPCGEAAASPASEGWSLATNIPDTVAYARAAAEKVAAALPMVSHPLLGWKEAYPAQRRPKGDTVVHSQWMRTAVMAVELRRLVGLITSLRARLSVIRVEDYSALANRAVPPSWAPLLPDHHLDLTHSTAPLASLSKGLDKRAEHITSLATAVTKAALPMPPLWLTAFTSPKAVLLAFLPAASEVFQGVVRAFLVTSDAPPPEGAVVVSGVQLWNASWNLDGAITIAGTGSKLMSPTFALTLRVDSSNPSDMTAECPFLLSGAVGPKQLPSRYVELKHTADPREVAVYDLMTVELPTACRYDSQLRSLVVASPGLLCPLIPSDPQAEVSTGRSKLVQFIS